MEKQNIKIEVNHETLKRWKEDLKGIWLSTEHEVEDASDDAFRLLREVELILNEFDNKSSEESKLVRKYNSVDDFCNKQGFQNKGFNKSNIFNYNVCDLTIYKFISEGVFKSFSFYGKTKEEAEQKLLKWANNEQ